MTLPMRHAARPAPRRPRFLTPGERALAGAIAITALFGAALAFVVVLRFGHGAVLERALSPYEIWIVASGGFGAGAGMFLWRDRLGRRGGLWLVRALAGTVLVSVLGAVIAGTLALPLYGTMFGPFTLAVTLAGSPLLAVLWGVTQVSSHMLLRQFHDERDSIFAGSSAVPVSRLRGSAGWP